MPWIPGLIRIVSMITVGQSSQSVSKTSKTSEKYKVEVKRYVRVGEVGVRHIFEKCDIF